MVSRSLLILGVGACILGLSGMELPAEPAVYRKVVVIGDSISSHRPAEQELGWAGHWGMAASTIDKDYVHLFLSRLAASQNGVQPDCLIAGGGGGKVPEKLSAIPQIIEYKPDIAIIQLGENDRSGITRDGFQRPYEQLLEGIRKSNPQVRIFCFGVWSPPSGSFQKDAMIRAACRKFGAVFVDLTAANADPMNKAEAEKRFTHPGVNWHPGDKGMAAYADALWKVFEKPPVVAAEMADEPAQARSPIILVSEKWSGAGLPDWKPAPKIETSDGKPVACVRSQTPVSNLLRMSLPVEKIKGQYLTVSTRVKGDSISARPKSWNGVKVTLCLQDAEGRNDFPQATVPVGTFDWQEARVEMTVPDNIVSATLWLGLENVSGTVWFDSVTVTAQP